MLSLAIMLSKKLSFLPSAEGAIGALCGAGEEIFSATVVNTAEDAGASNRLGEPKEDGPEVAAGKVGAAGLTELLSSAISRAYRPLYV